jgi:ubiquitin C-terminal hydrolase
MKGIHNIGNTCYFNTSLQCLAHVPVLKCQFTHEPYTGACTFTRLFSTFIRTFWDDNNEMTLNVNALLTAFVEMFPRFTIGEQHDVQETILCIIDILERSIPHLKPHFYGKKTQETIWPGGKKTHEEVFSVHLLCSGPDTLADMLMRSVKWNTLVDYEDDEGKVHNVATTRCLFSEYPNVLMISFDKRGLVGVIEHLTIDGNEYELVASAIHAGVQRGGHYVAFTKHDGVWYYKDDDTVQKQDIPIMAPHYFLTYSLKNQTS